MQRGSLIRFPLKRQGFVWRFQWREPGYSGPRTRYLGRCAEVSRAEARKEADRILAQLNVLAPSRRSSVCSLATFVDETYLEVKTRSWKASTRYTTEQIIRDYILKEIGPESIAAIDRKRLQQLLDALAAGGKSSSVVNHVRFQLQAIFEMASGDGLITVNPTKGLCPPRCKRQADKRDMTVDQVLLAQSFLGIRERLIFGLATIQGIRPGEIVGLRRDDVFTSSAQDGTLMTVLRIDSRIYRGQEDTPKSDRGYRSIPLTADTAKQLEEYMAAFLPQSTDWLFPSESGKTPINPARVLLHIIRPVLAPMGLGWVNYQVMRRTFAIQFEKSEKDPLVRATVMGHTVDVHEQNYRRATEEQLQSAMRKHGETYQ
jgi:integrase